MNIREFRTTFEQAIQRPLYAVLVDQDEVNYRVGIVIGHDGEDQVSHEISFDQEVVFNNVEEALAAGLPTLVKIILQEDQNGDPSANHLTVDGDLI